MRCRTCKFFEVAHDEDYDGVCCRYPPRRYDSVEFPESGFPVTCRTWWCGEWQERKEPDARMDASVTGQ
jgi:hypothetical protein